MATDSVSSTSSAITALGLGSGLDIEAIVDELVTAEMAPANNRVERAQESVDTQVSALATLKSALATFQDTYEALTTGSDSSFAAHTATSSNEDVLTATTDSDAVPGTYNITVDQLAQSHQIISNTVSGGSSATVGTGTLTLSVGGESFSITIDDSNSSLAGIRDAINSASNNTGVNATLVYGTDGASLVLTSAETGADNTITVAASGGDGGLSALAYSDTNTANYTVEQEAQDAIVTIAGIEHSSSTNTISDAIDGITLELNEAAPSETIRLQVENDTDSVVSKVNSFITAYNTLATQLDSLGSYDSETGESGALFGDSLLKNLSSQLRHALTDTVSSATGSYNSLASLGITFDTDGQLTLDEDKLESALASDFDAVTNVLGASDGVIERVNSLIDTTLASDGSIEVRSNSLDKQQDSIDAEKEEIELRAAVIEQRYLDKYNAMDSLLAELENLSSYLEQQFDALNKDSD